MELTLESALSPGGMVGNLSYVLLIASMAMRRMFWLRVLAIGSGLAGIAYDVIWLRDPVGTFWESAFTLTNIIQWMLLIREDRKLRLSPEEFSTWKAFFPSLSARECKQLFIASRHLDGRAGEILIRRGQVVKNIYILLTGEVSIRLDDVEVSRCGPGDLLGEMSFLSGEPASADTVMTADCAMMEVDQNHLASLIKGSDELGRSINNLISMNLVQKLNRQTQREGATAL